MNYLVKFHNGDMEFGSKDRVSKADMTVTFRTSEVLLNFLLADFGEALRKFLQADSLVLRDLLHFDFGQGLRDLLFAHSQGLRDFLVPSKRIS